MCECARVFQVITAASIKWKMVGWLEMSWLFVISLSINFEFWTVYRGYFFLCLAISIQLNQALIDFLTHTCLWNVHECTCMSCDFGATKISYYWRGTGRYACMGNMVILFINIRNPLVQIVYSRLPLGMSPILIYSDIFCCIMINFVSGDTQQNFGMIYLKKSLIWVLK